MLDLNVVFDPERPPDTIMSSPPSIEKGGRYIGAEKLPEHWREVYEERAGIREFCGEQPREHAEAEALKETIAAMERHYHSARLVVDN